MVTPSGDDEIRTRTERDLNPLLLPIEQHPLPPVGLEVLLIYVDLDNIVRKSILKALN